MPLTASERDSALIAVDKHINESVTLVKEKLNGLLPDELAVLAKTAGWTGNHQQALVTALRAGDPTAGPLAALTQPERFHWLVAPASTVVQPAEVHTGMTADPEGTLAHLFAALVARPGS